MDAHRCQAQCHSPLLHEAKRFQAGDICFSKFIRADVSVSDVKQRDCFLRVQLGYRAALHRSVPNMWTEEWRPKPGFAEATDLKTLLGRPGESGRRCSPLAFSLRRTLEAQRGYDECPRHTRD